MGYKHTNSKGQTYYLKSTEVTLRGGKLHTIYFFVKDVENSKGTACDLPEGRTVVENERNGFLVIKRTDS